MTETNGRGTKGESIVKWSRSNGILIIVLTTNFSVLLPNIFKQKKQVSNV